MRSWISVLAAFIALNAFDAPAQQPPENLTGHYLTGFHGEGVFIEHQYAQYSRSLRRYRF